VEMKGGRWVDRSAATTATVEDFTATAVQHLSEQVRQLFLAALSNVPTEARETSSTTIAISSARLAGAIERIARFRRELVQYLEQDAERDDVYQLEVNFFPLTTLKQLHAAEKENPDGTTGDAVPDPGAKPRTRR
jgi:hypothetical protein